MSDKDKKELTKAEKERLKRVRERQSFIDEQNKAARGSIYVNGAKIVADKIARGIEDEETKAWDEFMESRQEAAKELAIANQKEHEEGFKKSRAAAKKAEKESQKKK